MRALSPGPRVGTGSDGGKGREGGKVGADRRDPAHSGLGVSFVPAREAERRPGAALTSAESQGRGHLPRPNFLRPRSSPEQSRMGKFLPQPRGGPPHPPDPVPVPPTCLREPRCGQGRSVGARPSPSLGGPPGCPERLRRLDFFSPRGWLDSSRPIYPDSALLTSILRDRQCLHPLSLACPSLWVLASPLYPRLLVLCHPSSMSTLGTTHPSVQPLAFLLRLTSMLQPRRSVLHTQSAVSHLPATLSPCLECALENPSTPTHPSIPAAKCLL